MKRNALKFCAITLLFFVLEISSVSAKKDPIVAVVVYDGEIIQMTESQHREFEKAEEKKYKEAMRETKRREEEAIEKGVKIGKENIVSKIGKKIKPFNVGLWSSVSNVNNGSSYLDRDKKSKISPTIVGPGTISIRYSIGVSASANISLNKLKAAGLSITKYISPNENFSVSFDVKRNRRAHIEFIPRYRDITGYKEEYFCATLLDRTFFRVSEPLKVGRLADGEYRLVYE